MSAILNEILVDIARAVRMAPHGQKGAIYDAACQKYGISKQTLLRKLNGVAGKKPRKTRRDKGKTCITMNDMKYIAGSIIQATRQNNKRNLGVAHAADELRDAGLVVASRMDKETGELIPVHPDTVRRAMKRAQMHPDQLKQPAPSVQLRSKHANHVWEMDASMCVLYYLKKPKKSKTTAPTSLHMMYEDEFNKNKPRNAERVTDYRVWSFEITDHNSGWIYVEYRFGGEKAEHYADVLINAMQERGGADVLHGVPEILFTDPGSALIATSFGNMCRALGIRMIQHKARNARATGSVEKARDIIERRFESLLSFEGVADLDDLNARARVWRMKFNRTVIHSRHKKTRTDRWLESVNGHLVKAPPEALCRDAAMHAPESRRVGSDMHISFAGQSFSVARLVAMDQVCIGDNVQVTRNLFSPDAVYVVMKGEDGWDKFYECKVADVIEGDYFRVDACVIGEEYRVLPETKAQKNLKEVEMLIAGSDTPVKPEDIRKSKTLPFGGGFKPLTALDNEYHPEYMPVKGEDSPLTRRHLDIPPLTHVQAAMSLRTKLKAQGREWNPGHYQYLVEHYPDGIPEELLDIVMQTLLLMSDTNVISLAAGR
ncbi:transposase family protein [Salmonella enterica]|uniref:Transposase n=1 Tax=Salmonella enterica TaxID=28901 RepID=A0A3K5RG41_SALER|nr:transposase [Salmonella enterica]EAU5156206.1 transposase [Salmonella enterica]EAZ4795590.1 transposase family protein [Salmonella enterica]EBA6828811.1 transposase family protein [Salmonella enterica]EBI6116144.1 transposase [Salmonella enterica]